MWVPGGKEGTWLEVVNLGVLVVVVVGVEGWRWGLSHIWLITVPLM